MCVCVFAQRWASLPFAGGRLWSIFKNPFRTECYWLSATYLEMPLSFESPINQRNRSPGLILSSQNHKVSFVLHSLKSCRDHISLAGRFESTEQEFAYCSCLFHIDDIINVCLSTRTRMLYFLFWAYMSFSVYARWIFLSGFIVFLMRFIE